MKTFTSRTTTRSFPRPHRISLYVGMLLLSMVFTSAQASDTYAEGYEAAIAGDYQTAYKIWKPLANQNDGRAQFGLALMFHAGLYVDQNEIIAMQLYRLAAENDIRQAQEYLAIGYQNGWFGLPKDTKQAAYWTGRASH